MRKTFFLLGVASTALTINLGWTPVAAQTADGSSASAIAEVVVTARRRAENVQEVPLAVQAFNQEMLEQKGIGEVRDLKYAVGAAASISASGGTT